MRIIVGLFFCQVLFFNCQVNKQTITIGKAVTLPGADTIRGFEPYAMHDRNGNLLVGAMNRRGWINLQNDHDIKDRLIIWHSDDDGNTWGEPQTLGNWPDSIFIAQGDPWIQTDGKGNFYFIHCFIDASRKPRTKPIAFYSSKDNGKTFSGADTIGIAITDKCVFDLAKDNRSMALAFLGADTGENNPKPWVLLSNDSGKNWTMTSTIVLDSGAFGLPFGIIYGKNGKLMAGWNVAKTRNSEKIAITTSVDNGKTWMNHPLGDFPGTPLTEFIPGPVLDEGPDDRVHAIYIKQNGKLFSIAAKNTSDYINWSKETTIYTDSSARHLTYPAVSIMDEKKMAVSWMSYKDSAFTLYASFSMDGGNRWSKPEIASIPLETNDLIDTNGKFKEPAGHYTSMTNNGKDKYFIFWGAGETKRDKKTVVYMKQKIWFNVLKSE